jgi:tetratricopeptide (TPR) repeat protein
MVKKIFIILLMSISTMTYIFSNSQLTDNEQTIIDDTLKFRMDIAAAETPAKAIEMIDSYTEKLPTKATYNSSSDEIKLVIQNMLVWEKYNYIYETNVDDPRLKDLLVNQYKIITDWLKSHKNEQINKWLYCSAGDILSSGLRFFPMSTAMKEGLNVKKYYDLILEEDPNMSFALFNIAHWYFHAPAISGGSKKKAKECFEKAVESARNPAELYFSKVYYSQILFENEDFEGCEKQKSEAAVILPNSRYIQLLNKVNSLGHSVFYYTLNKEKMDKIIK